LHECIRGDLFRLWALGGAAALVLLSYHDTHAGRALSTLWGTSSAEDYGEHPLPKTVVNILC
jgi:hypothetical protein